MRLNHMKSNDLAHSLYPGAHDSRKPKAFLDALEDKALQTQIVDLAGGTGSAMKITAPSARG
jgi:hypothetical protein